MKLNLFICLAIIVLIIFAMSVFVSMIIIDHYNEEYGDLKYPKNQYLRGYRQGEIRPRRERVFFRNGDF